MSGRGTIGRCIRVVVAGGEAKTVGNRASVMTRAGRSLTITKFPAKGAFTFDGELRRILDGETDYDLRARTVPTSRLESSGSVVVRTKTSFRVE